MSSKIIIDETKCVGCKACIRACPAPEANKAISKNDGECIIDIDPDRCIKCGACIKACTHGARDYVDDSEAFFKALDKGEYIGVIVAPAVRVAYKDRWKNILNTIRGLGAAKIFDVSYGADICTWAHLKYVKEHKGAKVISQPCAAIVNYALKYNNDLLKNLSPIHSPMLCEASYVRNYTNFSGKLAVLSPCVAKGDEFSATGLVQYNVTFKRALEYIEKEKVPMGLPNFTFDVAEGLEGSIYPMPGGLKECLLMHERSLNVITSEGSDKVYNDLDEYTTVQQNQLPDVFDVLNCEFGCNDGPGVGGTSNMFEISTIMYDLKSKKSRLKNGQALSESEKRFGEYNRKLKLEHFLREYTIDSTNDKYAVSKQDIDRAFKAMNKSTHEERTFDCHACGYKSCRLMATAIAKGLDIPENCMQNQIHLAIQEKETLTNVNNFVKGTSDSINEKFNELENNIGTIRQCVEDTEKLNNGNSKSLKSLNKTMLNLGEISAKINDAVDSINKSVKNYANMTKSVNEIATQISILSINANIEAVRAGAAGKGFAVVASQVGNLARSSQSTVSDADVINKAISDDMKSISEIAETIIGSVDSIQAEIAKISESIQTTVDNGNRISDETGAVTEIADAVNEMLRQTAESLERA